MMKTPYRAPKAYVPKVRAICKRFLVLNERHLSRLVKEYKLYFNHTRPHQDINQQIPAASTTDAAMTTGAIISQPVLGGLHHDYRRAAC
jgi:putative transposase